MIKRALAFLLLLVAGFAILYAATGEESLARFGAGTNEIKPTAEPPENRPGVSVEIDEGRSQLSDVKLSYRGGIEGMKTRRQLTLPDGSLRELPVYSLSCADSRPMRDGRQELIDAEVTFYETSGPPHDPVAVESGQLRAKRAYVELGEDDEGRPSITQDKDIDLVEAVVETGAQARIQNLRFTIERAKVRSTDTAVHIVTAGDDMPITVEILAERGPATLTGRGLRAVFPLESDGEEDAPLHRLNVDVLHEPELVHHGERGLSTLRATGPLRYVEDPASGNAEISVVGHVELETAGATAGTSQSGTLTAFGDRLHATLRRGKGSAGSRRTQLRWHSLHLVGEEAGLRSDDMHLTCKAVDVTPNVLGEPWLFTASGTPHLTYTADGREMKFDAAERIHLVRLAAHLGPWQRARSWADTIVPPPTQLLIFEGASSLELPHENGNLRLLAQSGLRVLRGDVASAPVTVRGHGDVDLQSEGGTTPLALSGNDGFVLHNDARGQMLQLGPRAAAAGHRFEVQSDDLQVRGSGSCRLFRPATPGEPGWIVLASPNHDIELTLPGTEGSLRGVADLTAYFDDAGLQRFDGRGPDCRIAWQDAQGKIDGRANHIWTTGNDAYHLAGQPAEVTSDRGGTFEGDHIRIVRLSEQQVILEAEQNARLIARDLVQGTDGQEEAEPLNLNLSADRILYLPFLAPGSGPAALPTAALHTPHLLARGNVVVEHVESEDQPASHARGETLVLQLAEQIMGRLLGAPASITRRDAAGQVVVGEAPEILLAGEGEDIRLLPGTDVVRFTLSNRKGGLAGFGSEDGSTRLVCDGPVDADAEEIRFHGWVEGRSLRADGSEDPNGFHLDAQRMHMERDAETGQIVRVFAVDGAKLRWRRIEAVADQLSVDLITHMCTAVDRLALAHVRLPNGVWGRCRRAEFNYLTYEARAWHNQVAVDRNSK